MIERQYTAEEGSIARIVRSFAFHSNIYRVEIKIIAPDTDTFDEILTPLHEFDILPEYVQMHWDAERQVSLDEAHYVISVFYQSST